MFLIYLSLPEIGVLSLGRSAIGQIGGWCLIACILIILLEFLLGVMYRKQLFLKIQISVYRNVLFLVGVFSITSEPPYPTSYVILIIVATIALMIICWLLCKETYSRHLLLDRGLPIDGYLLIFQVILCFYSNQSQENKNILLFVMIAFSAWIRCTLVESPYRKCRALEYTLIKV